MPEGKYVSFAVYIGSQKLPEYRIKDNVFTEVDLLGPSSYTIEEDGQKYPVVPFTIELMRLCPYIVWITVFLDGQRVTSRPLIKKMTCDGVKTGNEIHELLFSLPKMVEDQQKENPLGDYAGTISVQVLSVRCTGERVMPVYKTDMPSSGVTQPQVLHHLTKKDVQRAIHYNTGGIVSREGRPLLSLIRTNQSRLSSCFVTQDLLEEVTLIYRPRIFSHVPQSPSLKLNLPTSQEEVVGPQSLAGKRIPLGDVANCSHPEKMSMSPATKPDSRQKSLASKEDQRLVTAPSEGRSLLGERSHAASKQPERCVAPAEEINSQERRRIPLEEIKRRESGLITSEQVQQNISSMISPEEIKRQESSLITSEQVQQNISSMISPEEIKRQESSLITSEQVQQNISSLISPEEIKRRESGLVTSERVRQNVSSMISPEEIKRRESGLLTQIKQNISGMISPEEIKRRESGLGPTEQVKYHNSNIIHPEEIKPQETCMIPPEQIKRRESCMIPSEQIKRRESPMPLDQIKRRESSMMEFGESGLQLLDQIKRRESCVPTGQAIQQICISDDEGEAESSEKKVLLKREAKDWGELSYVMVGDSDDEDQEVYVYEYESDSVVYMGDDDCYLMDLSQNISLIDLENCELDDELDLS